MKKAKTIKKLKQKPVRKISLIISIIAGGVLLIGILAYQLLAPMVALVEKDIRQKRIESIYTRLDLNDNYRLERESILGEKIVYSWDKGRSYSSMKEYVRGANVDTTVNEVRAAIERAGFSYFEEPYPGSKYTQLHFKSDKNEYIRLTVSSKVRDDAIFNKQLMGVEPSAEYDLDANQGPSNVAIKVNLDDNNE